MARIETAFIEDMKPFGEDVAAACFNCGTCAAICPLVSDHFPRKIIRYVQIGAKDRILEHSRDLWQCLHCGLCTQTCPRGANPGEIILSLKRYVVANWRRS